MKAEDVTATLELALKASGCNGACNTVNPPHKIINQMCQSLL